MRRRWPTNSSHWIGTGLVFPMPAKTQAEHSTHALRKDPYLIRICRPHSDLCWIHHQPDAGGIRGSRGRTVRGQQLGEGRSKYIDWKGNTILTPLCAPSRRSCLVLFLGLLVSCVLRSSFEELLASFPDLVGREWWKVGKHVKGRGRCRARNIERGRAGLT